MVSEPIYSPHYDFYIDKVERSTGYDMHTFHIHKKYEIYYAAKGIRRYYIEDNSYLVHPGDVVLIGPDGIHKTSSVDNLPHTRYVLNFSAEYLEDIQAAFPNVNLFSCFEAQIYLPQTSAQMQASLELFFKQLWENHEQNAPKSVATRKLLLAQLLLLLDECVIQHKEKNITRHLFSNPVIEKIQSYIATHYEEELTLSGIASQFFISPHYLSRLFKKVTNLSITEYINSIRLKSAKTMLEATNLPITQVAERNGFQTPTHFHRTFKMGTGLSPQKYRKLYGKASNDPDSAAR